MFDDVFVLVVLFLVLIGTLALFQYLPKWFKKSKDPALALGLLEEWLQVHGVSMPTVEEVVAILNQQLIKSLESKNEAQQHEIELMSMSGLISKTELPKFSIYQAELASENSDIVLSCTAEWPMCLPGVRVEVREKDNPELIICHFSIDWMTAQMKITLSDSKEGLLLSYRNIEPFRMGVACMVKEGKAKDGERMASQVADILQLMLMGLSLDRVPVAMEKDNTPSPTTSIPQLLVSSVDEGDSPSESGSEPQLPGPIENESDINDVVKETREVEESVKESEQQQQEVVAPEVERPAESAPGTVREESSPSSESGRTRAEVSSAQDQEDTASSSASDPSLLEGALGMPNGVATTTTQPAVESNHQTDPTSQPTVLPPLHPRPHPQGNGLIRTNSVGTSTPSTDCSNQVSSPWRRSPSYEKLEEDEMEGWGLKQRSNSTDVLNSPTRTCVSSPAGKTSLTLSIAGSDAGSVYGADERVPSTLVFEIEEGSGRVRHIMAMSTSHAIKLRQKYKSAKKLHIYNDHIFLASKLSSKAECAVCKEKLNKKFGKTGYMCRCCEMVVHKQCHWKMDERCSKSTVHSLKIESEGKNSSGLVLSP